MEQIEQLEVTRDTVLGEALRRMEEGGMGVLLLVDDERRLVRVVTDGDLRRLLLAGASMDAPLSRLPGKEPVVATGEVSEGEALAVMDRAEVDHLPLVDGEGRPVRIILRREVDSKVLLSAPHMGDEEWRYVEEAFRTNWVAPVGPNVDAFEQELADYLRIPHVVAVSSGTAALHLALRVLEVGHGDVVFCSSLTFIASANPILYQGATPVFIDSEPGTWNMSATALARALSDYAEAGQLPKAVIVVNLYGQSADLDPILGACEQYGVPVVEDAAESLGATYKGKASGTIGRLGVYSFNGNKIITTSGGGALVSADGDLIEKAKYLATQAKDPAPWYEHREVGYNYRMSNVLAGIGRGQLRLLEERIEARRAVFERYREGLEGVRGLRWMPEASFGRATRWLSVCELDVEECASEPQEIISALARRGIEARRVWKPMHRQPLFAGCPYYPHEEGASFSDRVFERGLCLPSGSGMSAADQARVIRSLRTVLGM